LSLTLATSAPRALSGETLGDLVTHPWMRSRASRPRLAVFLELHHHRLASAEGMAKPIPIERPTASRSGVDATTRHSCDIGPPELPRLIERRLDEIVVGPMRCRGHAPDDAA